MNLETFILKCQEVINGEFEVLRIGDRFVETDYGKLRISYCHFAQNNIDAVEYTAFGIEAKFRPHVNYEGQYNYAMIIEQLSLLVASRWMERHREIDAIEMHIRELEKIRKASVTYIRHFGMRPRVDVVLDGTENLIMFTINGAGIKYLPSRTAIGDTTNRAGSPVTVRTVAEIKAVPIEGYERIMERRCGSRLMDLFASADVHYIPATEDENFGWIEVGSPLCPIMRVEPVDLSNNIIEHLREHPKLGGLHITVANIYQWHRRNEPCKGHVQWAEVRLSSPNNSDFAIWWRLYDNCKANITQGTDETSELAVQLINAYLDPIALGLNH